MKLKLLKVFYLEKSINTNNDACINTSNHMVSSAINDKFNEW